MKRKKTLRTRTLVPSMHLKVIIMAIFMVLYLTAAIQINTQYIALVKSHKAVDKSPWVVSPLDTPHNTTWSLFLWSVLHSYIHIFIFLMYALFFMLFIKWSMSASPVAVTSHLPKTLSGVAGRDFCPSLPPGLFSDSCALSWSDAV